MAKAMPTEIIKNIGVNKKDSSGNEIIQVFAKGNEYAIYEILDEDINNKLRVQIDGLNDESEKKLIEQFNLVKQKYIEAKGLLYRSTNFGMMKNRVAHTLATSLSSDSMDGNKEFQKLIDDIKEEQKAVAFHRILYLLPSILCIIGASILASIFFDTDNNLLSQFIIIFLASSLGGSLSIFINTKNLHFEEYNKWYIYFMFGFERIFLALIVGSITYILIKAKLLLGSIPIEDFWMMMSILIVASFSESFIPSVLGKIMKKA